MPLASTTTTHTRFTLCWHSPWLLLLVYPRLSSALHLDAVTGILRTPALQRPHHTTYALLVAAAYIPYYTTTRFSGASRAVGRPAFRRWLRAA